MYKPKLKAGDTIQNMRPSPSAIDSFLVIEIIIKDNIYHYKLKVLDNIKTDWPIREVYAKNWDHSFTYKKVIDAAKIWREALKI